MVVRFLIAGGGPVRYMGDHRISRHLELREFYPGAFLFMLVDISGENVGNEVGLQHVGIAALVALFAFVEISFFPGKAVGEHKRIVEDELGIAVGIQDHRRIGNSQKFHRLPSAVDQSMPAVERRRKKAHPSPLEETFFLSLLPYFRRADAIKDADQLFVEMLFRLQGASGRNLGNVHAGNAFHAMKVNERTQAAGASPTSELDVADIFHAVTDCHRNALAFHPLVIPGLLQCVQQSVEVAHILTLHPTCDSALIGKTVIKHIRIFWTTKCTLLLCLRKAAKTPRTKNSKHEIRNSKQFQMTKICKIRDKLRSDSVF